MNTRGGRFPAMLPFSVGRFSRFTPDGVVSLRPASTVAAQPGCQAFAANYAARASRATMCGETMHRTDEAKPRCFFGVAPGHKSPENDMQTGEGPLTHTRRWSLNWRVSRSRPVHKLVSFSEVFFNQTWSDSNPLAKAVHVDSSSITPP